MYNRTVPGNTNSYTVTGLSDDVNYNVSVAAVNRCGMMTSDPVTVYGECQNYCFVRVVKIEVGFCSITISYHVISLNLFRETLTLPFIFA